MYTRSNLKRSLKTTHRAHWRLFETVSVTLFYCATCRYDAEHTNTDPFRMLFNAASSEKETMMGLNERLGDLFCRLDRNKGDAGGNCIVYMQAIECLHEELRLQKACYETEISKLRYRQTQLETEITQ